MERGSVWRVGPIFIFRIGTYKYSLQQAGNTVMFCSGPSTLEFEKESSKFRSRSSVK